MLTSRLKILKKEMPIFSNFKIKSIEKWQTRMVRQINLLWKSTRRRIEILFAMLARHNAGNLNRLLRKIFATSIHFAKLGARTLL